MNINNFIKQFNIYQLNNTPYNSPYAGNQKRRKHPMGEDCSSSKTPHSEDCSSTLYLLTAWSLN